MGLYKYTSNKDPQDGTAEIRLPGRDPVPVGGQIELSEEEHDLLKSRLNLRAVEADSTEQGDTKGTTPESREGGDK
jgi:hypothetical protein